MSIYRREGMKLLISLLLIIQHQVIAGALGGPSPSIVDRWANEVTTSFTTANSSLALQHLNDAIVHYGALRGDVVGLLQQVCVSNGIKLNLINKPLMALTKPQLFLKSRP